MKIMTPRHEIMKTDGDVYKHIEKIGRVCYKSEDAITYSSAEPFVKRLFANGHHAMIEHYRFIVVVNEYIYDMLISNGHSKYLTFTEDNRYVISASARGFNDMYTAVSNDRHHDPFTDNIIYCLDDIVYRIMLDYGCPVVFNEHFNKLCKQYFGHGVVRTIKCFDELSDIEYNAHAWYSVHLTCDRGVTHELVRHRDASFAQESTRYCNYTNGKYGGELTFIRPLFWAEDSDQYRMWWSTCKYIEKMYNDLINMGSTPQMARSILSNSLKSEIVITAQVYEWIHIFNLRVLGTTGAPHPQMREVMSLVYYEMNDKDMLRSLMCN